MGFMTADRFYQSESQCHGKSDCNAFCTFCPGESCNRLEVFPHPLLLYLICPSRSLPRWACPPLASCPFPPFLAFLSSFQRNAEPELWCHFPRKEWGTFPSDNLKISFRQSQISLLKAQISLKLSQISVRQSQSKVDKVWRQSVFMW